jgi:hypothetical protein
MAKDNALNAPAIPFDDEEPAFVPGRRYLFLAPGGFTLRGVYVRALGLGAHRFKNVSHMRNAGNREFAQICRQGIGKGVWTSAFPRYWNGTPICWADYLAEDF